MKTPEFSPSKNEALSPGEKKALEYAKRILNGESYDSITEGLGPVMIAAINQALVKLGYGQPNAVAAYGYEAPDTDPLSDYVKEISKGRNPAVQELYADLLANRLDPEKRTQLTRALIGDTYRKLRTSDYQSDPEEDSVWAYARDNQPLPVKEENNWMYRGYFGKGDEPTVTRGSFNVHLTPELISALDQYIASGVIKANYKFGAPNTPASPVERHDAISIYFLEKPNTEALADLAQIIKPYIRGDNLLGEKMSDGFYLSEIGSVQDEHIQQLIDQVEAIDPDFAKDVKLEMTHKGRLAMSEAQFYALKKAAKVFGYNIDYNPKSGFTVAV